VKKGEQDFDVQVWRCPGGDVEGMEKTLAQDILQKLQAGLDVSVGKVFSLRRFKHGEAIAKPRNIHAS
jgi:hypothetical protein